MSKSTDKCQDCGFDPCECICSHNLLQRECAICAKVAQIQSLKTEIKRLEKVVYELNSANSVKSREIQSLKAQLKPYNDLNCWNCGESVTLKTSYEGQCRKCAGVTGNGENSGLDDGVPIL